MDKKYCKDLIQFIYPTFFISPSKLIKYVISNYTNSLKYRKRQRTKFNQNKCFSKQ